MKKFAFLILAVGSFYMFNGCSGDYTCSCTVTEVSTGTVLGTGDTLYSGKKSDAKVWCEAQNVELLGIKTDCGLE